MNFTTHNLDLVVQGPQIEESVKALVHTILLHRTSGKFNYKYDSTYSVGTIGVEEKCCHTVDLAYMQCEAPDMENWVDMQVNSFATSLRQKPLPVVGQILLEFYEKKKGRWLLPGEIVSWEGWLIKVRVVRLDSDEERQEQQAGLVAALTDHIMSITQTINRSDYLPKTPVSEELASVFDTRFHEVQPYLHKFTYELKEDTVSSTVRKFIQNTFNY
jgi:autophagy-related protein 101